MQSTLLRKTKHLGFCQHTKPYGIEDASLSWIRIYKGPDDWLKSSIWFETISLQLIKVSLDKSLHQFHRLGPFITLSSLLFLQQCTPGTAALFSWPALASEGEKDWRIHVGGEAIAHPSQGLHAFGAQTFTESSGSSRVHRPRSFKADMTHRKHCKKKKTFQYTTKAVICWKWFIWMTNIILLRCCRGFAFIPVLYTAITGV